MHDHWLHLAMTDEPLPFALVTLANGARSVRSLAHEETFHPVVGPVAEAQAIYLRQMRLIERLRARPTDFVVWDVGLGAAANPVIVLQATRTVPSSIRLLSFDTTVEPLQFALQHADALGYLNGYEETLRQLVESGQCQARHDAQSVHWTLHLGDYPSLLHSPSARTWPAPHAILYDPFSAARNPAMWTLPHFRRLFELLSEPCALATYSRSTMLRVTLLLAGFFVGTGHATGEKEETTIAANRSELVEAPLDAGWLRRVRNSTSAEPLLEPTYRQAPLSAPFWDQLLEHPQFLR